MNTKTRIQQLVKEHLNLINHSTLDQAKAHLNDEQWQSFWEVIVKRYQSQIQKDITDAGITLSTYSDEDHWQACWDMLIKLYPTYILEKQNEKN